MATVLRHYLNLAVGDSREKLTPVQLRISEADAQAYMTAVDDAARAATAAGLLAAAIEGVTAGTVWSKGVSISVLDDTAIFPTDNADVYNFDKILVGLKAGLERSHFTIPSRDGTAYTVGSDGVSIILTDPGRTAAVADLITQVEATVLNKQGDAVTLERAEVVS